MFILCKKFPPEKQICLDKNEKLLKPIAVERSDTVGRYLVAIRDLQPLDLILADEAAASGPLHEDTVVCLGCLKPLHKGVVSTEFVR